VALVDQDEEHLRLLSTLHYVYAGVSAFFACIPIIHFAVGMVLITNPSMFGTGKNAPPEFIGYLFAIIGALAVVVGWTVAICSFFVGRFLARRRHRLFCLIVSGVNCTMMPLGTALGVFTLIVLLRPAVKEMFVQPPPLPGHGAVQQLGL
jgi:hypothetical protein